MPDPVDDNSNPDTGNGNPPPKDPPLQGGGKRGTAEPVAPVKPE